LAAKSATATRAFETPRPVPVLNQSWADTGKAKKKLMQAQMNTDKHGYKYDFR
jgi:hypothetical protein